MPIPLNIYDSIWLIWNLRQIFPNGTMENVNYNPKRRRKAIKKNVQKKISSDKAITNIAFIDGNISFFDVQSQEDYINIQTNEKIY